MLVFIVLTSLAVLTGSVRQETPDTLPGYADLAGFDFNDRLACIDNSGFLYYREVLYSPEDFAASIVETKPVALNVGRVDPGNYGTYRMLVRLPEAGMTYTLCGDSAMYAQRLFY